ncbi:hypothetical protein R50345_30525 [Paenibacillus sp. FSL R5-0345]|uniref:ATP-binding protein n=1 Tax=Paenibacillus sp. FSL R5-0345 TaxID=1536770 RepID=UPI0004F827BA|nr:ATP-binding protein [Paenibacillus sp. FSL R5-0345]AIQ38569.1 hypothetical protein R50345_30525 [Paenibacillus sp. FSL R5-0345]
MKTKNLPPRATRMIEGLRDTGYEFNTAMADVIDNSIAANASSIEIDILMDFAGDISIYIADNGCGMNEQGLDDAMTYGSLERPDPSSLGKFGLGLKTASTAFCRCLSVITRAGAGIDPIKARWDLDYISDVAKDWVLQFPEIDPYELELLEKVTGGSSGTIVVWENVDRVMKAYSDQGGPHARKALDKIVDNLREHVAMVFERFLDTNFTTAPNVVIKLNQDPVIPWDPFCKSEPETKLVAKKIQPVIIDEYGAKTTFDIKAYVIPRKEGFTSEDAWKLAKLNNDMQGFYIYRENRLIHYGDWLGMFRNEPHGTLLRIEFSFDHTLDDAFNVDIKKSRIMLTGELYNWLKEKFLPAPRRVGDDRYRKGVSSTVNKVSKGAHDGSNAGIGSREKEVQISKIEVKNPGVNEVEVTNKKGKFTIKIPVIDPVKEGELFVQPVESIDEGMLWEPCIIGEHHAVRINTKHSYYHKVYVPNLASGVTIQGMDSLLWALSEAELGTINDSTRYHLKELRYEVSKILRRLVEDLPEPEINNE